MKTEKLVLAFCLVLCPAPSRAIRKEQWEADLRDCAELGISRSSLLAGAFNTSATARLRDTVQRGSKILIYTTKGRTMRVAIGTLGIALTIASSTVVGIHTVLPESTDNPQASVTTVVNEDWKNGISSEPSSESLRQGTITVNATNENVPEAFTRARDIGKQVRLAFENGYDVIVDPQIPKDMDSVTIVDVKTGGILGSFSMNNNGSALH